MGKLIKVYSHPRSGTHLLEAFLAKNFYPKKDFFVKDVLWGHWSDRRRREEGNEFGLLFGSHEFPGEWVKNVKNPIIYIYRDGRDVAYSIWKTPNFINGKYSGISFSDFLEIKIDWEGTPAKRVEPKEDIISHWNRHVREWRRVNKKNLLILRYEDLVENPKKIFESILKKFFRFKYFLYILKIFRPKVVVIDTLVGLKPNRGVANGWKENFSEFEKQKFSDKLSSKKLPNE